MLSVTWAFGPPIDMEVVAHGPIENKWLTLDLRRSAAKHLLFLVEGQNFRYGPLARPQPTT
jgi:hypothetical protein